MHEPRSCGTVYSIYSLQGRYRVYHRRYKHVYYLATILEVIWNFLSPDVYHRKSMPTVFIHKPRCTTQIILSLITTSMHTGVETIYTRTQCINSTATLEMT